MKYTFLLLLFICQCYSSNLININFKDLSIEELITITSKKIGKNILLTEKIEGSVDFISNSPIDENRLLDILKYSLKPKGYILIEDNNIIRIVKKSTLVKKTINKKKKVFFKKEKKNKSFNELVYLENNDATSVAKTLDLIISKKDYKNKVKPVIAIDELTNSIIINANLSQIEELKDLIIKLDKPKKQVYIKALIIELDNDLIEEIGISYGILGGKSYSGGLYTFASNLNGGDAIAIDTSAIGLNIPNVSETIALGASLNLLNRTYGLDIISEPSILCVNNSESSIYVGETISIQTGRTVTDGGNTSITYEREDVGLSLKVKPRISKDEKVFLDVITLVENIKNRNSFNVNPDTSKKEINTKAILNNGESVIIGGLIEKKKENSIQKIPLAGDIPLIGELFKNRQNNSQNKNLVIVITPYIIPKNRDLTYIRKELSKLKSLEDEFLEKVLIKLREKSTKTAEKKEKRNFHQEMYNKYFNM
ncbi:type II secretion system protein GspD [Campylobacterota bacterium DY0563]